MDAENYKLLMFTNNLSRSLTSLTVSLRDSELKMSLAMTGRVDEMVFKNPFQPKPHCGSVIPCHIPHTHSELQSKAATCSPRVPPLLPSLLFPLTVQAAGCSLAFFSDVAPKLLCSNVFKSFRYQKLKEVRSRLGECICKWCYCCWWLCCFHSPPVQSPYGGADTCYGFETKQSNV